MCTLNVCGTLLGMSLGQRVSCSPRVLPVHTHANVDTHARALWVFAETHPCSAWLWTSGHPTCGARASSSARLCWRVPHNCHPVPPPPRPVAGRGGAECLLHPLLPLIVITYRSWHRICPTSSQAERCSVTRRPERGPGPALGGTCPMGLTPQSLATGERGCPVCP